MSCPRLLLFLEGSGPDGDGRFIEEVLAFDDSQIEHVHTFIQWLFPLTEPSRAQPQSPVLAEGEADLIRQSNLAQQNLLMATERMLASSVARTLIPQGPERASVSSAFRIAAMI